MFFLSLSLFCGYFKVVFKREKNHYRPLFPLVELTVTKNNAIIKQQFAGSVAWRFSAAVALVSKSGHLAAASLDMLLSLPSASLFVSLSSCSHSSMQLSCSHTVLHHLLPLSHHARFLTLILDKYRRAEKHAMCQEVETQLALR